MEIKEVRGGVRLVDLTVTEKELQWIARALFKDNTNSDENGDLYGSVVGQMDDFDIPRNY